MSINKPIVALITLLIWSTDPVHTGTVDRISNYSLVPINEINLTDLDIYRPNLFSVDDNSGNIAIYSYADHRVHFIPNGSLTVREYGNGLGGGPEEFRNPTDIDFDESGNFWVSDPHQARISMWSPDSGLTGTINYEYSVPEKLAISDNFYVIKDQVYSPIHGLLRLFERNSNEQNRFAKLPDELTESALLMDSMISADSERVYITMLNAGIIYCYDRNGTLMYERSTIDPIEIANLELAELKGIAGYSNLKVQKLSQESLRAVLDHDINSSQLLLLFDGTSKGIGHFIDIHDKFTGLYNGSIMLEEVTERYVLGIEVADNNIFLQTLDKSHNYRIEQYELIKKP